MPRYTTLDQIDRAGHDLRLWCYACARGATIDAIIWQRFAERGLPLMLDQARRHFPCRRCGARDCLIVPATRPPMIGDPLKNLIAAFFHGQRSAAKKAARTQRNKSSSEFRL